MKAKGMNNNLGNIIKINKETVAGTAKKMGVSKDLMGKWIAGYAIPSSEKMQYIAGWFMVHVSDIWPASRMKTEWNIVFNAVTDRLAAINYHKEPELYTRLCNWRSVASVKIYAKRRRTIIQELDKHRKYTSGSLVPSDFAVVTPMLRNSCPAILRK
jgi:transcriptional regulator with XRE-family HTH domain